MKVKKDGEEVPLCNVDTLILSTDDTTNDHDDVTSNGGKDEESAKSLGSSEGDGGGAKHVRAIHNEQNHAANKIQC